MRTFLALDLPESVKDNIAKIEINFKSCSLETKWVNPKNLHLTLKFLGEAKEEKINQIKEIIKEVASSLKQFEVNFKGFGFFPNEKKPRVFFASTDNEQNLKQISYRLEEKLEKIGFPKEGRFKSHITLARFKSNKNIDWLKDKIKNIRLDVAFNIEEIILFKSTLSRTGPVYEKMSAAQLNK